MKEAKKPPTDEHRMREPLVPIPHATTNIGYTVYRIYKDVSPPPPSRVIVKLRLKETAVEKRKHVYAIMQYTFCGEIVLACAVVRQRHD